LQHHPCLRQAALQEARLPGPGAAGGARGRFRRSRSQRYGLLAQRKPERSEHLHPDPSLLPGRLGSRARQQRSGERFPKGRGQGRGRRPQQGPPVRIRRAGRVAAGPSGGRVPRRVPELRGGGR
ncbi:unnamed protein product, partial [Ectocarpus sp. 12 AP-2014]